MQIEILNTLQEKGIRTKEELDNILKKVDHYDKIKKRIDEYMMEEDSDDNSFGYDEVGEYVAGQFNW